MSSDPRAANVLRITSVIGVSPMYLNGGYDPVHIENMKLGLIVDGVVPFCISCQSVFIIYALCFHFTSSGVETVNI